MRIFKPALITLLAACLAASGAFARAAKTTTHGKSPSLSASAKKRKTSASTSKKHVKSHGAPAHAALGEHFEGSFDIPPEDLPVGDDEDSPNP